MSDPDYKPQAQTGVSGMNSVTKSSKVTAPGMKTPSWTGAAQQGRAAMQSYLSQHPLTVYANVRSNVSSVTAEHNAQGNIVDKETLTWVAEGNKAEAIIPLEGDRTRALKLYQETGKRLGLFSEEAQEGVQTGRSGAVSAAGLDQLIKAVERCAELLEAGSVIQMDKDVVAGKLLPTISRKMGVLARK